MAVAMRAKKIRHYSAPTHTVFSSKRIYRRNWYRALTGPVGGHIGIAGRVVSAYIELAPRGGPLPIYHGGRPQKGPGPAVRAFDVDSFHG